MMTTRGSACSSPALHASTIACTLLPPCDARKPNRSFDIRQPQTAERGAGVAIQYAASLTDDGTPGNTDVTVHVC